MARAEQDRAGGAGERTEAAADQATTAVLLAQAEQQDRRAEEARQVAGHEPDPTERAEATAEAVDRGVTSEGLRDAGQAKPATEAVQGPGPKSAKTRKSRGHGPQVQHAGVER